MNIVYAIIFGMFAGAFLFERGDYVVTIICLFCALLFGFAGTSMEDIEHEKSVK